MQQNLTPEVNRIAEVQQISRAEENYVPPAPLPPSVDILSQHVAHAHSRQGTSNT